MTKTDSHWLENFLRDEAAEYLENVVVTQQEHQDILEWVNSGESVYDNPWLLYDEYGRIMDYIVAQRVMNELATEYLGDPNAL